MLDSARIVSSFPEGSTPFQLIASCVFRRFFGLKGPIEPPFNIKGNAVVAPGKTLADQEALIVERAASPKVRDDYASTWVVPSERSARNPAHP